MLKNKRHPVILILNILFFFVVILFHYTNAFNLKIYTATPMLVLPLLVAFSLFSSVSKAAAVGLFSGIFMDSVASGSRSFNALILMLIAAFVCVASNNLFNKNIQSAVVLSLICCIFYFVVYWIVFHTFSKELESSLAYLLKYALPSAVYSAAFIFPFYYIYKHFNKIKSE